MSMERQPRTTSSDSSGATISKADHAYSVILERIAAGTYPSGTRLIIERIARELDMSVVPVREAVRRLQAEGHILYQRNVGATVGTIDLERFPEVFQVVALLESAAMQLATPHLTPSDIAAARALNDRLRERIDDLDPIAFTRTNQQFHETLFQRCPNRHLLGLLQREWTLLNTTRRSTFFFLPDRASQSVAEHDTLLDLIETGRPVDEIADFLWEHRMNAARQLLHHLGVGDADAFPDVRPSALWLGAVTG
jgi:DNA-binding GntR family transcriptional regulator